MYYSKSALFICVISLFLCSSCQCQQTNTPIVGGPCQGCEAIFDYGTKNLTAIDTLPDFANLPSRQAGAKPKLKLTGNVLQKDGITPAANIILYIYHTDRKGVYTPNTNAEGWAKKHGYLRGWIKTDATGVYTFYTFRPAAYPNRSDPEHIHITVKEPHKNEYYIDSVVFDDDPLLTPKERESLENRGGSGITQPVIENGILTVKRDIILGANIPNYE